MDLMFLIAKDCVIVKDLKAVNETEIKNLLENLDIKKASGIDTIPPKLEQLLADYLTPLLTNVINTSII